MGEYVRRVRPAPTDAYLANPHKGCCTFQHFNGDELFPGLSWSEEGPHEFPARKGGVADGYLPATVAYCRWFWETFEPEEGKYDFSLIDKSLETAHARGQTLALRLMPFGSHGQPLAPQWYRRKYPMETVDYMGSPALFPVHDAPEYLEKYGNLIREAGRRYDGNPLLETMDVGFIGPWGEGAGEMSAGQMDRFHRLHQEAFPKTLRLIEICGEQGKIGLKYGTGWRWNCFGDLSDGGSPEVLKTCSWNHTFDCYPEVLATYARDNWKQYPVHCETAWVVGGWYRNGWDLDFILQQGLKYHLTYFMPKSSRFPEPWLEKLSAWCRKIGYRFVYRQALYETPVRAGGLVRFQSWIENVGCAPIYRPYSFAIRLRQGGREEIIPLQDVDIRTWLPGDTFVDVRVRLPASIKPGWVHLAAGLLDPATREARVSFAVKEAFSDRWVSLGGIEVLAP